jgi:hypothetical protein
MTSISGSITATNNKPVPGASVYLSTTRQSTTAKDDGAYQFTYELGNNYSLVNQIPTVTETVSVEAIACEPQSGKRVQVQAESGAHGVDFGLNRCFYPPDIDLSQFTFDTFSGWSEARQYSTWQNILGITIEKPNELKRLLFGTKPISTKSFDIGNKKLFLVTNPRTGRYFIELEGNLDTRYAVGVAATLNSKYFDPQVESKLFERNIQRLRLELKNDGMKLVSIEVVNVSPWIAAGAVGLGGGLVAAYFITVRRARGPKKERAGIKWPKMKWPKIKRATEAKAQKKARKDAEAKTEIKPRERPTKGKHTGK